MARAWNKGKEAPRWGVADLQKMSPPTTVGHATDMQLQKSRISSAYVSITKSAGLKQLSTQQFGFGQIYSTQHFLVELVSTYF